MIQTNELINLALVAVLSPLIYWTAKGVAVPQRRLFAGALISMAVAFAATVIEGLFLEDLFNLLEHASFAFAGLLFMVAIGKTLRESEGGAASS